MTDQPDLHDRLAAALRADGWRPAAERPLLILPSPGRYVRPLDDGWAAKLHVLHEHEPEVELEHGWRRGMREAVSVEASVFLPAAERLIAQLDPDTGALGGYAAAAPFAPPGERGNSLQFRGPDDHPAVVTQVAAYARDVVLPAAAGASFDGWRQEHERWRREAEAEEWWDAGPDWELPLMLVALGRGAEALERIAQIDRDSAAEGDAEWRTIADGLAAFARSGAPLPTDDAALAAATEVRDARNAAIQAEGDALRAELRRQSNHELRVSGIKLGTVAAAAAFRAWRRRR